MIIVTGSVTASAETDAEMAELCLTHVRRSRTEPGCLLHAVHRDVENHHRFVFLEHWISRTTLEQHFEVPESIAFVKAIRVIAIDATKMQIFETVES
ncbi:MAG: antibiotic biosynthesis monooxygenase [Ilumatobacter sp.]|jgi:quinol monooxygenase YgiN|nr:antibiotic biosynthesis monooxygenase [Ilumatobacter sp.]